VAFQQNGYAIIPQSVSYDEWRSYLLRTGVNVDYMFQGGYGNQCWDSCALLWYQYGLRLQTGNGFAYGCWTLERHQNARPPFELVYGKENIKRGDVIVFDRHGSWYTGHIGYADEDYNGTNTIKCLGQNQGQDISYGTPSNVVNQNLTWFLGGFRNTNWTITPPTPPTPSGGSKPTAKRFPWVLYANKLRNKW
jgi:hypothetical protein